MIGADNFSFKTPYCRGCSGIGKAQRHKSRVVSNIDRRTVHALRLLSTLPSPVSSTTATALAQRTAPSPAQDAASNTADPACWRKCVAASISSKTFADQRQYNVNHALAVDVSPVQLTSPQVDIRMFVVRLHSPQHLSPVNF